MTMEAQSAAVHTMAVMGKSGDTKIAWSPGNPDEVQLAKDHFDALKKKGYLAFTVKAGGNQGEKVSAFDPQLKEILFVPPMAGG